MRLDWCWMLEIIEKSYWSAKNGLDIFIMGFLLLEREKLWENITKFVNKRGEEKEYLPFLYSFKCCFWIKNVHIKDHPEMVSSKFRKNSCFYRWIIFNWLNLRWFFATNFIFISFNCDTYSSKAPTVTYIYCNFISKFYW